MSETKELRATTAILGEQNKRLLEQVTKIARVMRGRCVDLFDEGSVVDIDLAVTRWFERYDKDQGDCEIECAAGLQANQIRTYLDPLTEHANEGTYDMVLRSFQVMEAEAHKQKRALEHSQGDAESRANIISRARKELVRLSPPCHNSASLKALAKWHVEEVRHLRGNADAGPAEGRRIEALRLTERIAKLERWVEHLRCAHEAARLIAGRVLEEVDSE